MKAKHWLLIGAILLSAYAGDMLVRRAVVSNTHLQPEKIGRQTTAVANGLPAAALQGVPPKEFGSRLKRGASDPSPETVSDVTEPEELTPSGVPINDPGSLDPEEVENRLLADQLAESLRNPAYLQATAGAPSADIEPDTPEATEAGSPGVETAELLGAEGGADHQSEQALEEETALNDAEAAEPPPKNDQSAGRPQLTEAGVPVSEHGSLDPAEVEALLLAEQLAESLRNPAYLQPAPVESNFEETEEED